MCAAYGAKFSPSQGGQDGYAPLSTDDAPAHVSVGSGRPISWGAHDVFAKWDGKRWMQGLPIWAKPQDIRLEGVNQPGDPGHRDGDIEQARGKQGEPALTAWCQAYCADRGWLKEFILRKEVWGWDYGALSKAIKGAVVSTGYTTEVEVKLNWDEQEAMVMPSNPWTRINNEVSSPQRILAQLLTRPDFLPRHSVHHPHLPLGLLLPVPLSSPLGRR